MKKNIIMLLFLTLGILVGVITTITAAHPYDCPDWPECSAEYGCGCAVQYKLSWICKPFQERDAYGPLQSLDTPGPYDNYINNGSLLCYKWRNCIQIEVSMGFLCVGWSNTYFCIPTLLNLCPLCYPSGEWHTVNRVDYDCYN